MTDKRIKRSTIEASEWFALAQDGELSLAERQGFDEWLRESPAHVEEYLELAGLWDEMADIGKLRNVDFDALLAETDNVVPLSDVQDLAPGTGQEVAPTGKRFTWWVWAAAIVLTVTATWWAVLSGGPANVVVATAVGEQRSLALDDGSVVSLNTRSSIRVRLTATERRAELLQGEALFDISRDEDRPFIVVAGSTEVRVLGTTFNVYRPDDRTATVTVLEGRVAVMRRAPNTPLATGGQGAASVERGPIRGDGGVSGIELIEGQQVSVDAVKAAVEPEQANVEKVIAWTERRLIFEGTALVDVLAEFNRYNTRTLRVVDPELAAIRLNGVFESHDPDSLLQYLERSQGIEVREHGTQRLLVFGPR